MAESGRVGRRRSPHEQSVDLALAIASLRNEGADRLDPVRFHFIEALARRALQHPENVRRIVYGRLSDELAAYRERFEHAKSDARQTTARVAPRYPQVADDLQRLLVDGDFGGLRRFVAGLESGARHSSLAELTRHLAQHSTDHGDGRLGDDSGSRSELKTIRNFRKTWSKLSVDKQVTQAIEQGPENAGPLNSHQLVLRSLTLMREISPDYLNRFMSYVDTLLWLDQAQADKRNKPMLKKTPTAKATRK